MRLFGNGHIRLCWILTAWILCLTNLNGYSQTQNSVLSIATAVSPKTSSNTASKAEKTESTTSKTKAVTSKTTAGAGTTSAKPGTNKQQSTAAKASTKPASSTAKTASSISKPASSTAKSTAKAGTTSAKPTTNNAAKSASGSNGKTSASPAKQANASAKPATNQTAKQATTTQQTTAAKASTKPASNTAASTSSEQTTASTNQTNSAAKTGAKPANSATKAVSTNTKQTNSTAKASTTSTKQTNSTAKAGTTSNKQTTKQSTSTKSTTAKTTKTHVQPQSNHRQPSQTQWNPNTAHMQPDTLEIGLGMVKEQFVLTYVLNETTLREDYMRNKVSFRRIREALARSPQIDSIAIYAYASPEGGYKHNFDLSKARAEAARDFIIANMPPDSSLDPNNIIMHPMGENWAGLEAEIEANYHRHDKKIVLKIIRDRKIGDETRKWRLKQLDKGYTWNFILRRHMPALRTASWVCVWMKDLPPIVMPIDFGIPQTLEQPMTLAEYPEIPEPHAPWLAVKTNILSDAFLLPNIGAEIALGNHVSLQGNWTYAWWIHDPGHLYWSCYGGDASLRYWLGPRAKDNRLCGHHLGLYGQMFTYDFELGWRGYQTAEWAYTLGLEYGYSAPIGKNLNVDFSIGAGWLNGNTKEYLPIDTHYVWQRTIDFPQFCITKAEISLKWVIGRGRYKQRKHDYDNWQGVHRVNNYSTTRRINGGTVSPTIKTTARQTDSNEAESGQKGGEL